MRICRSQLRMPPEICSASTEAAGCSSSPVCPSGCPWCFTKLLRLVDAFLRTRSVRLIVYLKDLLFMAQDADQLPTHVRWAVDLFQSLGFLISWEKSNLLPSTSVEFLGFMVDSPAVFLSLPARKLQTICKELRRTLARPRVQLRHLASVIGPLSASIQAIFPAPLPLPPVMLSSAYLVSPVLQTLGKGIWFSSCLDYIPTIQYKQQNRKVRSGEYHHP